MHTLPGAARFSHNSSVNSAAGIKGRILSWLNYVGSLSEKIDRWRQRRYCGAAGLTANDENIRSTIERKVSVALGPTQLSDVTLPYNVCRGVPEYVCIRTLRVRTCAFACMEIYLRRTHLHCLPVLASDGPPDLARPFHSAGYWELLR
jgi:hypothetical protein